MHARSLDTDPEAEEVQINLLRRASLARRAQMALSLSGLVIGMARRALRRSLPAATEEDARLRFVERHYGLELADELRRHLAARRR